MFATSGKVCCIKAFILNVACTQMYVCVYVHVCRSARSPKLCAVSLPPPQQECIHLYIFLCDTLPVVP